MKTEFLRNVNTSFDILNVRAFNSKAASNTLSRAIACKSLDNYTNANSETYVQLYDTTAALFWNHSLGIYLQKSVRIAKEGDTNYYKKEI